MTETMNCEPSQETRSAISTLVVVSSFKGLATTLHAIQRLTKREPKTKRMMDGWVSWLKEKEKKRKEDEEEERRRRQVQRSRFGSGR